MNECGASPEIIGEHTEKFKSLEAGQNELSVNLIEVKTDLKELISLLRTHIEQSQAKLESKQEKLESKIETVQKESQEQLDKFKNFLLGLGIKIITGALGVGLLAIIWYISRVSTHVLG